MTIHSKNHLEGAHSSVQEAGKRAGIIKLLRELRDDNPIVFRIARALALRWDVEVYCPGCESLMDVQYALPPSEAITEDDPSCLRLVYPPHRSVFFGKCHICGLLETFESHPRSEISTIEVKFDEDERV